MLRAIKLLESVVDLQLGNSSPKKWLENMAGLASCNAAAALSWSKGHPEIYVLECSEHLTQIPPEWIEQADQLITQSESPMGRLLCDVATEQDDTTTIRPPHLIAPNLMAGCLDSSEQRTLLILNCTDKPGGWLDADREHFRELVPALTKANELHKHCSLIKNQINIGNRVLDGAPRGIVAMTPMGETIKVNTLANDLIASNDGFAVNEEIFRICNDKVGAQFAEQLEKIRSLKIDQLNTFTWNRSFARTNQPGLFQLVLRAYPFEDWQLAANAHDRFVVLFIHTPGKSPHATADNLREFYDLSPAQARVVEALLSGYSIAETSENLHLSVYTVRSHLHAIYARLEVNNQSELMRLLAMTMVNYESNVE